MPLAFLAANPSSAAAQPTPRAESTSGAVRERVIHELCRVGFAAVNE